MKRRNIFIISAALAIGAVTVWVITKQNLSRPTESSVQVMSPTPSPKSTPSPPIVSSGARQLPGGPYTPADPRWAERRELRKEDPKHEWKTPIEFYGKVLDQDGNPVSGAVADISWTDMSANGSSQMEVTSEGDGSFSITGIRGKHMTVRVTKEGYQRQLTGTQSAFEYAGFWEPTYHEPDPESPVIFRLRKEGVAEPMVRRGPTLIGARNDGTPTNFDLEAGRKAATGSGDVALRISKGPKTGKRFDWTVTIEGVSGSGLIESNDEFMVMAPADGYLPKWTFSQEAGDEQYLSEVQTKFYVKTGDGKYARVEMRIIPEYNETAAVDLNVYLNPSGSRNVEFDPSKLVKSP